MGDASAQEEALEATREMTSGALKAAGEMASSFVPKAAGGGAAQPAARKKAPARKAPARKTKRGE